jgi:hypothetical protein
MFSYIASLMSGRTRFSVAMIAICLFTSSVSLASDYRRTTTPHFAFYFHPGDERLAASLIEKAERMRGEIVEDLGFDFKGITQVYLAPSPSKYQEIQPGRWVPSWSAGVAYPGLNLIILKSPGAIKGGHIDLEKVLKHELTHIAVGRAFEGREEVPRWLDEGLAMYESREWDFSRVSAITRAVLTDSLIPLSQITDRFPPGADRAELAYVQSFYLVSFLVSTYGKVSFHRFIREYGSGTGLEKVLEKVYSLRWDEFEERWKDYLKVRFSWIPLITSATTLWFLVTIVFIIAYVRKRKAKQRIFEQWEKEDDDP